SATWLLRATAPLASFAASVSSSSGSPRTSTASLLPYTTLFRSPRRAAGSGTGTRCGASAVGGPGDRGATWEPPARNGWRGSWGSFVRGGAGRCGRRAGAGREAAVRRPVGSRPVGRGLSGADRVLGRLHGGEDVLTGDRAAGGDGREHPVHRLAHRGLELVLPRHQRQRLGAFGVDLHEHLRLLGVLGEGGIAVHQHRQGGEG